MKTYQISYDIHAPGENYTGLTTCIQFSSVKYSHILGSTWLIETPIGLQALHSRLSIWLDVNDEIFISEVEKSVFVGKQLNWFRGQYVHSISQIFNHGDPFKKSPGIFGPYFT